MALFPRPTTILFVVLGIYHIPKHYVLPSNGSEILNGMLHTFFTSHTRTPVSGILFYLYFYGKSNSPSSLIIPDESYLPFSLRRAHGQTSHFPFSQHCCCMYPGPASSLDADSSILVHGRLVLSPLPTVTVRTSGKYRSHDVGFTVSFRHA